MLKADATRDATLRAVHVDRAKLVIISAGRDDTSILICLTTRHLAPDVRISLAVNQQDNEVPARRAGADVVVNPLIAGLLLATTHSGSNRDYLADLATMGRVRSWNDASGRDRPHEGLTRARPAIIRDAHLRLLAGPRSS